MNLYSVSGDLLFSSRQPTLKRALEAAVKGGVALHGIDLRRARLCGADLDGMNAPGACLWGADFTDCDMAQANISGADARLATFTRACLADALCAGGDFDGAYFKDTLLGGVDFSACRFSCPSILTQPLHLCRDLSNAVYWHKGEVACALDHGVMRMQSTGQDVLLLGGRLFVNGALQPCGNSPPALTLA